MYNHLIPSSVFITFSGSSYAAPSPPVIAADKVPIPNTSAAYSDSPTRQGVAYGGSIGEDSGTTHAGGHSITQTYDSEDIHTDDSPPYYSSSKSLYDFPPVSGTIFDDTAEYGKPKDTDIVHNDLHLPHTSLHGSQIIPGTHQAYGPQNAYSGEGIRDSNVPLDAFIDVTTLFPKGFDQSLMGTSIENHPISSTDISNSAKNDYSSYSHIRASESTVPDVVGPQLSSKSLPVPLSLKLIPAKIIIPQESSVNGKTTQSHSGNLFSLYRSNVAAERPFIRRPSENYGITSPSSLDSNIKSSFRKFPDSIFRNDFSRELEGSSLDGFRASSHNSIPISETNIENSSQTQAIHNFNSHQYHPNRHRENSFNIHGDGKDDSIRNQPQAHQSTDTMKNHFSTHHLSNIAHSHDEGSREKTLHSFNDQVSQNTHFDDSNQSHQSIRTKLRLGNHNSVSNFGDPSSAIESDTFIPNSISSKEFLPMFPPYQSEIPVHAFRSAPPTIEEVNSTQKPSELRDFRKPKHNSLFPERSSEQILNILKDFYNRPVNTNSGTGPNQDQLRKNLPSKNFKVNSVHVTNNDMQLFNNIRQSSHGPAREYSIYNDEELADLRSKSAAFSTNDNAFNLIRLNSFEDDFDSDEDKFRPSNNAPATFDPSNSELLVVLPKDDTRKSSKSRLESSFHKRPSMSSYSAYKHGRLSDQQFDFRSKDSIDTINSLQIPPRIRGHQNSFNDGMQMRDIKRPNFDIHSFPNTESNSDEFPDIVIGAPRNIQDFLDGAKNIPLRSSLSSQEKLDKNRNFVANRGTNFMRLMPSNFPDNGNLRTINENIKFNLFSKYTNEQKPPSRFTSEERPNFRQNLRRPKKISNFHRSPKNNKLIMNDWMVTDKDSRFLQTFQYPHYHFTTPLGLQGQKKEISKRPKFVHHSNVSSFKRIKPKTQRKKIGSSEITRLEPVLNKVIKVVRAPNLSMTNHRLESDEPFHSSSKEIIEGEIREEPIDFLLSMNDNDRIHQTFSSIDDANSAAELAHEQNSDEIFGDEIFTSVSTIMNNSQPKSRVSNRKGILSKDATLVSKLTPVLVKNDVDEVKSNEIKVEPPAVTESKEFNNVIDNATLSFETVVQ